MDVNTSLIVPMSGFSCTVITDMDYLEEISSSLELGCESSEKLNKKLSCTFKK